MLQSSRGVNLLSNTLLETHSGLGTLRVLLDGTLDQVRVDQVKTLAFQIEMRCQMAIEDAGRQADFAGDGDGI